MTKLKRFKQKKHMSTKNMFLAFSLVLGILIIVVISKSYAIYKLQKDYDVIKSQIGNYPQGDVKIAVLVDGKETSKFPTYEDNYKIESVECSNGVNATFDVKNWQLNIVDMSATSTKCTLSFNSEKTNEETPIAYSKEELVALNEEIRNTSAKELADYLYPVGSIYMSTEDDTVEKVQNKFGGTWVKYGEDMTLVGASSTKVVNSTGGSSTHNHGGTTEGTTLTVNQIPAHQHAITIGGSDQYPAVVGVEGQTSGYGGATFVPMTGAAIAYYGNYYLVASATGGGKSHNHGISDSSNMPPYTAVYMYKRTA